MNIIEIVILELAAYAMLAPLYVALPKYKGSALVLKMATFYLVGLTIQQLSVNVLRYEKQNNFFLYHIGNVVQASTLLLMYREIFKKYVADTNKYVYRQIFIILIPLFMVFAIVNAIYYARQRRNHMVSGASGERLHRHR